MNKDFYTMKVNVGEEIGDTSVAMYTKIGKYVNKRYFQILRATKQWDHVRTDYTFPTVTGTQDYVLPDDFDREVYTLDTTNGKELERVDLADLVRSYPGDLTTQGSSERFAVIDSPVKAQPSSAAVVTVVSSSAADTSQTILIRGIVSGYETSETITLTGTTPANSTSQFSRIKGISKSAITAGSITVTSGATSLAVLPPKVTESRYKIMRLHYVPSGVISISVPYYMIPLPLVENNDYPLVDVADLIEIGAKADGWRFKKEFSKASVYESLFNKELMEYIWDKTNNPNQVVTFKPATFNRDDLV